MTNIDVVLAPVMRSYTSQQQSSNVDLGSKEEWSGKVEDGVVDSFKYDLPSVGYAFGYDYSNVERCMGSGSPKSSLSQVEGGDGSSPKAPSPWWRRWSPPPLPSLLNDCVGKFSDPNVDGENIGPYRYNYTFVSWQQFREIQLKKQELISKQIAGVWEGQQVGIDGEVVGLSPNGCPSLQQASCLEQSKKKHQRMAASKPVSIGAQRAKSERPGTGVFLPETLNPPPPSSLRKKNKAQPDGASKLILENQQNKTTQKASAPPDTRLPPEWIY